MNVFTKWGIAELNLSSKRLVLYHRLSPTFANNFGGFQGERAERRFCRWEMRDPKSPAQNRQIVTASDVQCQKKVARRRRCVIGSRAEMPRKEQWQKEWCKRITRQVWPWDFLAVTYYYRLPRLILKWCSQDHFGSWLPTPMIIKRFYLRDC